MKDKIGTFIRTWWDVVIGFLFIVFVTISFYVKSNAEFKNIEEFNIKVEKKVDSHETRISVIEGKMDTLINLQRDILNYVKNRR